MAESSDSAEVSGTPQATQVTPATASAAFVVITVDYCSNVFGVSPCTATASAGLKCYNTFPTCRKQADYVKSSKSYRFVSAIYPIPLELARPYVKTVKLLPTEIKTNLTVSGRVNVEMMDEPDGDVGVDPYVTERLTFPNIPGTFWKKWITRNRNFKGRQIDIYEGYVGNAEGTYAKRWTGSLENITLKGAVVKIEAVDYLADLEDIYVPPKLDLKLAADMTDVQTSLTIYGTNSAYGADADLLDNPSGALMIDSEVVTYTSIDPATGVIGGLTRGAHGTTAEAHDAQAKVQKVKVYADTNPFDLLKSMLLTDAEIPAARVDSAAFDYWKGYPGGEPTFSATITEPTELSTLFWEIVDLIDCKVWVGENLKITITRNLPSDVLRTYQSLSDASGIIHKSPEVDQNERSRLTRALIYWDKTATGAVDDTTAYARIDVGVNATAEDANAYGDIVEKTFMTRWLHSAGQVEETMSNYAKNLAMRQVWRNTDAQQILKMNVTLKDEAIKTGDWVYFTTDEIVDQYGQSMAGFEFQVVKREKKDNIITLSCVKGFSGGFGSGGSGGGGGGGNGRLMQISPDTMDGIAWADATDAQKAYGAICQDSGMMPGDVYDGYRIW